MKGIAGMRGRVEDEKTRDTFEWSFYKQYKYNQTKLTVQILFEVGTT